MSAATMRAVETINSRVSSLGTSLNATWIVTGATARARDQIIMTGCAGAPQRSASAPRNSVWPGNLKPAA